MDCKEAFDRLETVLAAHSEGKLSQLMQIYNDHAKYYDQDIQVMKWEGPRLIAESINRYLSDKSMNIVDICSGTGAVAEHLIQYDFKNIDCIDGSPEMLLIAMNKRLYRNYICQIISKKRGLLLRPDLYDATVVSGGKLLWDEMLRVTKTGGYCMAALLDFPQGLFLNNLKSLQDLEQKNVCKIIENSFVGTIERDHEGNGLDGRLLIIQKC